MPTQSPAIGFLRLSQIIGNPKANPPIPPILPIAASSWWAGIAAGKYPKPVKLGPRTTAWKLADIEALCAELASGKAGA